MFKNTEMNIITGKQKKKGSIFQETNKSLLDIGLILCNGRKPNKVY